MYKICTQNPKSITCRAKSVSKARLLSFFFNFLSLYFIKLHLLPFIDNTQQASVLCFLTLELCILFKVNLLIYNNLYYTSHTQLILLFLPSMTFCCCFVFLNIVTYSKQLIQEWVQEQGQLTSDHSIREKYLPLLRFHCLGINFQERLRPANPFLAPCQADDKSSTVQIILSIQSLELF